MLVHYLTIAFRQLRKNKFYSAISIAGLAIGLASVFLIYQYLIFETSFDRFHESAENIYRINWVDSDPQTRTPHPMALAMVRDFPEVENATTLTPIFGPGLIRRTFSIRNPEKNEVRFDETGVLAVDTTFLQVFSFPLIKGDAKTALKNPGGILISETLARKYFGTDEPVGKHLMANDDSRAVEVLGVFKDVPANAHFHFDILVSYVRMKLDVGNKEFYSWKDFGHYNYIKLRPGADAKQLQARMMDWVPKYMDWATPEQVAALKKRGHGFQLQPITDIHLRSNLNWELEANGNVTYVYMMAAAGALILIIAVLNFINLTTAQSTERAREIGIRKTLGAFRGQLSGQFIGETLMTALFSALIAMFIIEVSLPVFSSFTGYALDLHYLDFILFLGTLSVVAGLIAGIYPAFYLSIIKPSTVLKGKLMQSPGGGSFRQSFLVFQFFAAMVLISSSVIIYNQLDFIKHKNLGFNKEEVIVLPVKNRNSIQDRFEVLQTELQSIPEVLSVSATSNIPGRSFNQNAIFAATDPENRINASQAFIDDDFFKTLDIRLADGRFFTRSNIDDKNKFIINETAARQLFPDGAVGKELVWDTEEGPVRRTVVGVVKDFHFQSLHDPIRALLFMQGEAFNYVLIKTNTTSFTNTLQSVKEKWKSFDHQFSFEFSFLSDQLDQQYSREQKMASVMIFFSGLAMFITCVGLLGIAALSFRQRTKEVSIRKVLGATLTAIAWLLLKNFTKLVAIAVVFAVPVVWWTMKGWLNNFAFHTSIHPGVFVSSGILLLVVTWGTLSYLTLRIARVNPAETLKVE